MNVYEKATKVKEIILQYNKQKAMEFFLNGAVLSLNSVNTANSGNMINH